MSRPVAAIGTFLSIAILAGILTVAGMGAVAWWVVDVVLRGVWWDDTRVC